jgi:hypothetical protein
MTTFRKTKNKNYLSRGSLYDDYLKKNHPDNIRKTILQKSKFKKNSNIIKENIESESDNNDKKEEKENENEKEDEVKKDDNLRYSLSFGDEDEEEKEEEEDDKEEDQKLYDLLENENDPELKELRKYYFGEKDLKKSIKQVKPAIKKKVSNLKKTKKRKQHLPHLQKK